MAMAEGPRSPKLITILVLACLQLATVRPLPLEVRSRWIVDSETGRRVKLACVNWVGHLQPALPEGLHRQPISYIADTIAGLNFNCVRLTYSIYMLTRPAYVNSTVAQRFRHLNLTAEAAGIEKHNPGLLGLTHLQAYKRVVAGLHAAGVMVVLDNHVSKPKWCCGLDDGNGFFGDEFFDPGHWVIGVRRMAAAFRGVPNVVAMSLRNELRGNRSSPARWSKYMQRGAAAVHAANPDVLVVLSGLRYDTDLSFLPAYPVTLPFREKKIVYEAHWYSFGIQWEGGLPNHVCWNMTRRAEARTGYVALESANGTSAPLFMSEFGIDQRGINNNDNRYLNCVLAYLAEGDLDWALWTLQGSYYYRHDQEPHTNFEETYGIFNREWNKIRNPGFMKRLKAIQQPIQDPYLSAGPSYEVIYHPATGMCVEWSKEKSITLGSCEGVGSRWSYNPTVQGPIGLGGTSKCIASQGNGLSAILAENCSAPNNTLWSVVSLAQLQLATKDIDGQWMCLDGSSSPSILIKDCICITDRGCSPKQNPEQQWFKVITTDKQLHETV